MHKSLVILLILAVAMWIPQSVRADAVEDDNVKLRQQIAELERKAKTFKIANAAIARKIRAKRLQITRLGGTPPESSVANAEGPSPSAS